MHQAYHKQLPLTAKPVPHVHAQELAAMSAVLDQQPQVVGLVHKDLTARGVSGKKGREGMTAEQVVRAMLVKQMNGLSYLELAVHLADSQSYSTFCRLEPGVSPKKSALQSNIKRVRSQTWEAVNRLIVQCAIELKVETGKKNRTIKQLGVQDIAFSKHLGLQVTEMVKSAWVFKRLRRFRAGVEGIISSRGYSDSTAACGAVSSHLRHMPGAQ